MNLPARSFGCAARSLLVGAGLLLATLAAQASCPRDTPAGLNAQPVGEEMIVNGLPLTIRQVTSKQSREELLARIEQLWKDDDHEVRRTQAGEWEVISAHGEDCLTTLQLKDQPTAFGFLGISRPPTASETALPKRLPLKLPGGISINSSVASVDGPRRGYTIAFSSKRSMDDLNEYFARQLDGSGWQALRSHEVHSTDAQRARVFSAQKGREQVSIVLWEEGLTRALLNVSEAL